MSKNIESKQDNIGYQIPLIGFLVLLAILAPALLHTNQPEFLVERLGISILMASYFDTALYASYLLIGILTAIISNQVGKRKVFISFGSIGSAILYLSMTLTDIFPLILVFRFIQGGFTVLCWQTLMTMILDLSSEKNRGRNMGIFGIFMASAMGGGPVLGGIFASWGVFVPYYAAFILSFFAFIIALILLFNVAAYWSAAGLGWMILRLLWILLLLFWIMLNLFYWPFWLAQEDKSLRTTYANCARFLILNFWPALIITIACVVVVIISVLTTLPMLVATGAWLALVGATAVQRSLALQKSME